MPPARMKAPWPLHRVVLACLVTGIASYVVARSCAGVGRAVPPNNQQRDHSIRSLRLNYLKFTHPLLLVDMNSEGVELQTLKFDLSEQIAGFTKDGSTKVSIYIRDFRSGEWMGIGENENYDPASISKLAIFMGLLKMEHYKPGTLDSIISYSEPLNLPTQNSIRSSTLAFGRDYTVRELLEQMIVHSNNEANALLNNFIPEQYFSDVFRSLDLPVPDKSTTVYNLTAKDVSKFLRVLYNSTYVNSELSEYALELLTRTKFSEGLKAGLPDGTVISHKFGERNIAGSGVFQLHETGIVYKGTQNYLITVLTMGNDAEKLKKIVSSLSASTFSYFEETGKNIQ